MVAEKKTVKKTKKATPSTKADEFAVISTGGKQYQVKVGDSLKIEKIKGEYKKGDKITFDKVLLVDNGEDTTIGTPYITGAKVEAILEEAGKNKKVEVMKYRAKSRYLKRRGHRQPYFKVKIEKIK
jgi:large subunit ribosomal protein L21